MAPNSLFPAFVVIDYHSAYAPHKMTIPTKDWNPGAGFGDFETWAGASIAADTMVEALVDVMKEFFPSTSSFDGWTVYTKTDPDAIAIPRAAKVLGVAGTAATTPPIKATQATWTAKTTAGGIAKFSMMDIAAPATFERVTSGGLTADAIAFIDEWFASTNGWSGRDNTQPYFFLQLAYTMNEKLRREYHMT